MKRPVFRALICCALLGVMSLMAAPSASAGVQESSFENQAGVGRCLDAFVTPYAQPCNGTGYQRWIWNDQPGIQTPLRNDVIGSCVYARFDNLLAEMRPCDSGDFRLGRWGVNFPPGGRWAFIKNYARPSLCLANTGGETVRMLPCNNNDGRVRWALR